MGKQTKSESEETEHARGSALGLGLPREFSLTHKVDRPIETSYILNKAIALHEPDEQMNHRLISASTQSGRIRVHGLLGNPLNWNSGLKLHIEQSNLRKRLSGVPVLVIRPVKKGESVDTSLNSEGRISIPRPFRSHLRVSSSEGRVFIAVRLASPNTILVFGESSISSLLDESWLT